MFIFLKNKDYLDKEVFRLVELLDENSVSMSNDKGQQTESGSLGHKIPIELKDNSVSSPLIVSSLSIDDSISSIRISENNSSIGFSIENHNQYNKFIKAILSEQSVNSQVSENFVKKKTFEWIIRTFKEKKADTTFTSYLIDEISSSIHEYVFYFPMTNLEIGKPFDIGHVKFNYFTKEDFDTYSSHYNSNHPESTHNPYEGLRQRFQGTVFASIEVKAEHDKAEEIAFSYCALSVDILKMCSDTSELPFQKLSFDIESRTREPRNFEILSKSPAFPDDLTISLHSPRKHYFLNEPEWNRILQRQLLDFHAFLLNLKQDKSELEDLILIAINRYANAISNTDLHQRIAELFSILESLLLKDENSPIIETVCKYCSKLVFKSIDDRKFLINLLKEFYKIRSALVHHGKKKKIDMVKLKQLQYTVIMLLVSLIKKSSLHKTKISIQEEIDLEILKAY